MAVNTPNPEHEKTALHRQITRTLVGGTQAMRRARTLYLPQEPKETETAYEHRIERSVLVNFYKKTRDTFVGRVMKSMQITDDTPTSIQDIGDNIDNAGNDVTTFAKTLVSHAVDDGIVYVLADAPEFRAPTITTEDGEEVPMPRTRATDEEMGLRPYLKMITAEDMLGVSWDTDTKHIWRVRFRVYVRRPDPDDEFLDTTVEQIHVLELVRGEGEEGVGRVLKRVFEEAESGDQDDDDWIEVYRVLTEFDKIPVAAMYTEKKEDFVGMPLFIDLANLNIRHWQSTSDQANIVHVIRVPILFGEGLVDESTQKPQNITIAANSVVHGEPGADLRYVEHTGKAAEVGFKEIENLVADLVSMGVEIILNQRTGSQTATGRALDQAEADTLMNSIADAVENLFSELFIFLAEAFGEEVGEDGAGGINLNKDYALQTGDAAQMVTQLISLWGASGISHRALIEELKRRGVLSEDFDFEEDETLIEAERESNMEREARMVQMTTEASQPLDGEDDDDDEDDEE